MSYRYYDGADGRHYCHATEPTFVCPLGDPIVYVSAEDPDLGAESQTGHFVRPELLPRFEAAAEALGSDPFLLASAVRRYHSGKHGRLREGDRLTDRCAGCGSKMERRGYRTWIEEQVTDEAEMTSGEKISLRLNGAAYRQSETRYWTTKKEATAWCLRKYNEARGVTA